MINVLLIVSLDKEWSKQHFQVIFSLISHSLKCQFWTSWVFARKYSTLKEYSVLWWISCKCKKNPTIIHCGKNSVQIFSFPYFGSHCKVIKTSKPVWRYIAWQLPHSNCSQELSCKVFFMHWIIESLQLERTLKIKSNHKLWEASYPKFPHIFQEWKHASRQVPQGSWYFLSAQPVLSHSNLFMQPYPCAQWRYKVMNSRLTQTK